VTKGVAVAVSAGVLAGALISGPAFAHVEVEADKTQAGAKDVTLTFTGEAESGSAGIKSERVVLPAGIAPGDVTLVKAPAGWKFTTAADGFTLGGKALKVGEDAKFAVRLAQLPTDATTLSFKTLETYGDGDVVRWIDLPQAGQPEPDHPAPTITLKGAVKSSPSPSASPTASPSLTASAVPAISATPEQATEAPAKSGSHAGWWAAAAVVVVVALAGVLFWRRRGSSS
jgi:uncharacterized protein YcnI